MSTVGDLASPYDFTLSPTSPEERIRWAGPVIRQLLVGPAPIECRHDRFFRRSRENDRASQHRFRRLCVRASRPAEGDSTPALEHVLVQDVLDFTHVENLSSAEVARMRAIYQPLAESVRELVDATIRTEVDAETVAVVKAEIDAATARPRVEAARRRFRCPLHLRRGQDAVGKPRHRDSQSDRAAAKDQARPGRGRVHRLLSRRRVRGSTRPRARGNRAMVLDHVLGEAASDGVNPRFTGTISLRYVRATRLGTCTPKPESCGPKASRLRCRSPR